MIRGLEPSILHVPGDEPGTNAVWCSTKLNMKANSILQLESTILTTWGLLLRNYIGTGKVCFGYTAAERSSVAIEDLAMLGSPDTDILICEMEVKSTDYIHNLLHAAQEQHNQALKNSKHTLTATEIWLGPTGSALMNTMVNLNGPWSPNIAIEEEVCDPMVNIIVCLPKYLLMQMLAILSSARNCYKCGEIWIGNNSLVQKYMLRCQSS